MFNLKKDPGETIYPQEKPEKTARYYLLVKQMLDIELIKIYPKQFLAGTLPGVKEQALPEIMTKIELKVHKSEKGTIAHPTRAIVGN